MRFVILTLVFTALIAVTLANTVKEFHQILAKCANTTGADLKLLNDSFEGKPVNDEKVKCAQACTFKENKVMNANGEVDKEKMIEMVPTDLPENEQAGMKQAVGQCFDKRGEGECETAHLIVSCVLSKTAPPKDN